MNASAILWLLLSDPTAAQHTQFSSQYETCMSASEGVTSAMRDCADDEGVRLDLKLNAEYRAAMARLPDERARRALRLSERRWLKTRFGICEKEARAEQGGTMWLLIMDGCGLDVVAERIEWLQRYHR